MPLPPKPTATVSGTVFFNDGITAIPDAEIQILTPDGIPVYDKVLADGIYSAILNEGGFLMYALKDGVIISVNGDSNVVNLTIVAGQDQVVNVSTNSMLVSFLINDGSIYMMSKRCIKCPHVKVFPGGTFLIMDCKLTAETITINQGSLVACPFDEELEGGFA